MADYVCIQEFLANIDKLSIEDYYSTEKELFRKLPRLSQLLHSEDFDSEVSSLLDYPIPFERRRADGDHMAACVAALGAEVDDPVGGVDHLKSLRPTGTAAPTLTLALRLDF
jgi:hypothetical protein